MFTQDGRMQVEIRTVINTVMPAHRELLKMLHQIGAVEETEVRATLAAQDVRKAQLELFPDKEANSAAEG